MKSSIFIPTALIFSLAIGFLAGAFFTNLSESATPLNSPTAKRTSVNSPIETPLLIAHAGGGIGELPYTNSLEALNASVAKGFRFIELDFMRAKNGDFVLLHRKPTDAMQGKPIAYEELPNSAEEFVKTTMVGGLTPMSLITVLDWMQQNPEVYIVADIKKGSIEGLREIKALSKDKGNRFIAQIYHPDQYNEVKALGFENIILTVFMLGKPLAISVEDLGDFCREKDLFALTMPDSWFADDTFERLGEIDTPLFLHTTNGYGSAAKYFAAGVQGLYTDFITPRWVEDNRQSFEKQTEE